jgi:PEGA domain
MNRCSLSLLSLVVCTSLVAQQTPAPTNSAPESQAQTAAAPTGPPPPHTLLDGTPVRLRLSQTISSANAKVGQEIPFEVVEEIKVDDVVVLPKGATAIGTVTECNPKKSMGRAGKLNLNITYARLADQEKVALRATQDNKGGGHVGAMTGAMVATAVVFFPAAPLFLFIHGKDITIPQGTEITAFVEGDMHLNMANFGVASPAAAAPPQVAQASLVIDSTPPGADIEIDGAFVGNTPSTVAVAPGDREIAVKKKGFVDWSRKLSVTGGSIHLSAELDPASAPTQTPTAPSAPAASPAAALPPTAPSTTPASTTATPAPAPQ